MAQILNSTTADIETIFRFYDMAIAFQKTKFNKHWQGFDLGLVESEINEGRQYKIVEGDEVACVFAVTFNDPVIWGEKDNSPSIYIHRIVSHNNFKGKKYVEKIIEWAINYGRENGKEFVRMDTWGDNKKLMEYYTKCGFSFVGLTSEMSAENLPAHYDSIVLSLFEININNVAIS